jgi:hypothetical protein
MTSAVPQPADKLESRRLASACCRIERTSCIDRATSPTARKRAAREAREDHALNSREIAFEGDTDGSASAPRAQPPTHPPPTIAVADGSNDADAKTHRATVSSDP